MEHHNQPFRALPLALLLLLAASVPGSGTYAQTAPSPTAIPSVKEEVLELSRFVVTNGSDDDDYLAKSTLAGTRLRTDLKDVGSALSVVTKQFLEDTGARNTEELLVYTTGTEVGGTRGNYTGTGNAEVLTEREYIAQPHTNTRVRGLASADNTRDLFLSDIPWDNYNVDRIELQRGPNAILFGLGKPGGVINASIQQAVFKDTTKVETRTDSFGSARGSLELNRELIDGQLALRFNALKDRTYYQQEPAFRDDQRFYAALRFDPAIFNRGSARTSLRLNAESGKIRSNNPRSLPPMDRLTPWFATGDIQGGTRTYNSLKQFTGDLRYRNAYFATVPNSGFLVGTSPNYQPALSDSNNGMYTFFGDLASGVPTGSYYMNQSAYTQSGGLSRTGAVDGTIGGLFGANRFVMVATESELLRRIGVPFAFAYKNKTINDTSIFDYYNKLIDGPNKDERQDFETFNATLSQTFLKGRAGIELAYDFQDYSILNAAPYYGLGTGDAAITVDVNTILPDGTPNPNVGRPVIITRSVNGGFQRLFEREVANVTSYYEWDAKEHIDRSWLAKFLGRHVFTASASYNDVNSRSDTLAYAALESNGWDTAANKPLNIRREFNIMSYLGPDMRGLASPAGINLSNLQNQLTFPDGQIVLFDSTWNRPTSASAVGYVNPAATWVNPFNNQALTESENPANYVGWKNVPVKTLSLADGDYDALNFNSSRSRNVVESKFLVWQGHMFDGTVVPTFGYRKDRARSYTVRPPLTEFGVINTSPELNQLPSVPDNVVEGSTKTYSVVVHSPAFIRKRLPRGVSISLMYNGSTNFEPLAGRIDMAGNSIGNPTGNTEDYGVRISAFEDRVQLRVNKYKSTSEGTSYAPQNIWYLFAIENAAWVRAKRLQAGLSGNTVYEGSEYNYGNTVNGVFTQTAAERALQQQHVTTVLGNIIPEAIYNFWGQPLSDAKWQNNEGGSVNAPPGFTGTTSTLSEGYEFELHLRPVTNWNIFMNASRTTAAQSDIGGPALNAWVNARNLIWNEAGGAMWSNTTGTTTFSDLWNSNFFNNYQLQLSRSGTSMPEVRKWRFNLTNNYRFTDGRLKGINIGGAYRWEGKVGLGYRSITTQVNGVTVESVDLNDPFWGPTTGAVDLWIGYTRKLAKKYTWRTQLNVRDAFSKDRLIAINAQPDGGPAAFRIRYGADWSLTTSLEF